MSFGFCAGISDARWRCVDVTVIAQTIVSELRDMKRSQGRHIACVTVMQSELINN